MKVLAYSIEQAVSSLFYLTSYVLVLEQANNQVCRACVIAKAFELQVYPKTSSTIIIVEYRLPEPNFTIDRLALAMPIVEQYLDNVTLMFRKRPLGLDLRQITINMEFKVKRWFENNEI